METGKLWSLSSRRLEGKWGTTQPHKCYKYKQRNTIGYEEDINYLLCCGRHGFEEQEGSDVEWNEN